MAITAVTAIEFVSAAPTVTDIMAKQRYPWNGLVDITCKVSGIEADAGGYEFVVVAVNKETGKEYTGSTFSIQHNGEEVPDVCGNGDYSLLWNAREDMGQVVIERMTVRITLEALAVSVGKVQLWEGGPYWADRNIGAKKPEDYGLYFWWGDTTGHRPSGATFGFSFTSSNTPTEDKSLATLQSEGWVVQKDGTYMLASVHDAAHVKWGGSWRMPTWQELADLSNKCDWIWTTRNGVNGYVVCGRGAFISNSIFLPCAGFGYKTEFVASDSSYGRYWSSSLETYSRDEYVSGQALDFYSTRHSVYGAYSLTSGNSVRPVQ